MNKHQKYALCAGVFLICVCIGFGTTRIWKGVDDTQVEGDGYYPPKEVRSKAQKHSVEKKDSTTTTSGTAQVKEDVAPVKIVSKDVNRVGNFYSLRMVCVNIPKNVVISYEIPALKRKSRDGYFTKIPGCKSGSYQVNVNNAKTKDILLSEVVSGFLPVEEAKVEKMTAGQFQALLLNQNDNSLLGGKNPKIARSIMLSFVGLEEGEKRPSDILAVREKIAFGIWNSARVLQVGYDDSGRINSAIIQPVY